MDEITQTAQIIPTRTEAAMMLIIMALLIANLAATIYAASYEPVCVLAIMEEVE